MTNLYRQTMPKLVSRGGLLKVADPQSVGESTYLSGTLWDVLHYMTDSFEIPHLYLRHMDTGTVYVLEGVTLEGNFEPVPEP